MSTLPLSMAVGRLPASAQRWPPETVALAAVAGRREPAVVWAKAECPLGDAEIHADRAGGGPIHFGHRDHEHDLLFARHPQEVDQVRVSRQDLADGIDRGLPSPSPGMKFTLTFFGVDRCSPSCRRMFGDDAEDLRRLDDILRTRRGPRLARPRARVGPRCRERPP